MKLYAVIAVIGAIFIATGAALWHAEVGLVVYGVECIAGAYVGAYLTRMKEAP